MKQDGPLTPIVLAPAEAADFLCIPTRSLERLVSEGRITPLRICKERRYARQELDDFVERELAEERRKRDL